MLTLEFVGMENNRITRRGLIKAGGAAALGAAVAPIVKALAPLEDRLIVGSGEHTYEVHHDWLKPPVSIKFGDTHGVAQSRDGRIFVAHTVNGNSIRPNAIVVYGPDRKYITSWGENFAGGAHGLDIAVEDGNEFLYHCDTRRRVVVKTTLDGQLVWERGRPNQHEVYADGKKPYIPTNVAFAPNGDVIVADGYGSHWIHVWSKDGEYKGELIGPGNAEGQVSNPHGLWLDNRGKEPILAVADRGHGQVQNFTLDGKHHSYAKEGMRRPCHMKMSGDLMLVPDLSSVVTILDKENKPVALLGDGHPTNLRGAPREKFVPGQFVHPHDAIWMANGKDILVAEWVPIGRITLLKRVS
jgi:hypothetical protein